MCLCEGSALEKCWIKVLVFFSIVMIPVSLIQGTLNPYGTKPDDGIIISMSFSVGVASLQTLLSFAMVGQSCCPCMCFKMNVAGWLMLTLQLLHMAAWGLLFLIASKTAYEMIWTLIPIVFAEFVVFLVTLFFAIFVQNSYLVELNKERKVDQEASEVSTHILELFPQHTKDDIHTCVEKAIGPKLWKKQCWQDLVRAIKMHLSHSQEVKKTLTSYPNLTLNALASLVYYTSDVRRFGGSEDQCLYRILNLALITRDQKELAVWMPFYYYITEAHQNLPPYKGVVYRGLNRPITDVSKQYAQGALVVWIAFSSTTKNSNVIQDFVKPATINSPDAGGSWMILTIKKGIEIPFSLFPKEDEVLLYPNTTVLVKSVKNQKIPTRLDIVEFIEQEV